MHSADRSVSSRRRQLAGESALAVLTCLLVAVCVLAQNARSEPGKDDPNTPETSKTPGKEGGAKTPGKPGLPAGAVEVRFTDNSVLKLVLRDDRLPLDTPYGKLSIPIADVRQIDFATRISEETARRVEAALSDLASPQFKVREDASNVLLELGVQAYPALLKAAKSGDAEVVRRAEELLAKIRDAVPAEQLQVRERDVVHTAHSKIAGRIEVKTLKATTTQFGDVQLRLADALSLRSRAAQPEQELVAVEDGPDNLANLQDQVGKSYLFRVTGAANGPLWGTGTYTSDSALAAAAVHAGVLRVGQTGVVKVTIVAPLEAYQGSTSNGITSAPYGPWPGAYRVERRPPPGQ
jgi:hypothetical protein